MVEEGGAEAVAWRSRQGVAIASRIFEIRKGILIDQREMAACDWTVVDVGCMVCS